MFPLLLQYSEAQTTIRSIRSNEKTVCSIKEEPSFSQYPTLIIKADGWCYASGEMYSASPTSAFRDHHWAKSISGNLSKLRQCFFIVSLCVFLGMRSFSSTSSSLGYRWDVVLVFLPVCSEKNGPQAADLFQKPFFNFGFRVQITVMHSYVTVLFLFDQIRLSPVDPYTSKPGINESLYALVQVYWGSGGP